MRGDNRYEVPDRALVEQAERTSAELSADAALTREAYAGTGLDAAAHGEALLATARRLAGRGGERAVAAALLDRRREAKRRLAAKAADWVRDLVVRLGAVALEDRAEVDALDLPLRPVRPDRVEHMLRQMRELRPELPRARPILVRDDEDEAFLQAGLVLAADFDEADLACHRQDGIKRDLTKQVVAARRELVRLFRLLDRYVAIAARRGRRPIPGRSREVLDQLVGARRARRLRRQVEQVEQAEQAEVIDLPEPQAAPASTGD